MERVRVAWRPRLRFLRNRSRAQAARGWAAMVETSSPSRWGCCRSSWRRSDAGAQIPRLEGQCRNVARAISTHRFGLWPVLEAGREWITAKPEVIRHLDRIGPDKRILGKWTSTAGGPRVAFRGCYFMGLGPIASVPLPYLESGEVPPSDIKAHIVRASCASVPECTLTVLEICSAEVSRGPDEDRERRVGFCCRRYTRSLDSAGSGFPPQEGCHVLASGLCDTVRLK